MDPNANPTVHPTETEFVITQEMIDIARESIDSEQDYVPSQPVKNRPRLLNIIWALVILIAILIGLDKGATPPCS